MNAPLWAGRLAAACLAITLAAPAEAHDQYHSMKLAKTDVFATAALAAENAPDNPLAAKVRKANDRFHDVKAATAEGYAPIPCASSPTGGAMGIHYVNGDYLKDDAVDLAKPEAVMYEPKADGSLELVAVEYITGKGPASLEGHLFNFNSAPNRYGLGAFYELHVWAWKANPTGAFADNNPHVSCEAVKEGK